MEVERELPFAIEIAMCHASSKGIREYDDRQSTYWPVFFDSSGGTFSAHRDLGRLSSAGLAAASAARAVCHRPWAVDVGGLSWDLDRPRTGSRFGARMALWDSDPDGSELINNDDRATGSTERDIGQRGELDPFDGFCCTLPPVSGRAFRRHGRERDGMARRQYYLAVGLTAIFRRPLVDRLFSANDRRRKAGAFADPPSAVDRAREIPPKRGDIPHWTLRHTHRFS